MKNNKELREANEKLEELLSDEDMQRIEDLKLKAILDENTAKHEAFNDGVKEGMERGIKQGNNEAINKIALEMLKNGIAIDLVCKTTKLPSSEIEKLRSKII